MALTLEMMEQVILTLASKDDELRNHAEATLRQQMEDPRVGLPNLLGLIRASQHKVVRSLSAIILRRAITDDVDFWKSKLTPELQDEVKQTLVHVLSTDTDVDVRHRVRDCVSELAAIAVEAHQWEDLLSNLFDWVQSDNVLAREDALAIFAGLAMDLGDTLKPFSSNLIQIFQACLSDTAHLSVQVEALRATVAFMMTLEQEETSPFNGLLPLMMQALSGALNSGDEPKMEHAMQLFVDLVDSNALFVRPQLESLVEAMIHIALCDTLGEDIQHLALEFLVTLAEKTPSLARRKKDFIEKVFPIPLKIMTQIEDSPSLEEWTHIIDVERDDSLAIPNLGGESVDRLSHALGGKHLVNVGFTIIQQYLQNADWKFRHAGLIAIASIGEGCFKILKPEIGNVVDVVLQFVNDPHPRVRHAACHAIGQLGTDFVPTIQQTQISKIIPAIIPLISETSFPRIQAHACAAVSNLCEDSDSDAIAPFLDALLSTLLNVLPVGNRLVQEQAITAVAGIADCAAERFIPYYDTFMPLFKNILQNATDKDHRLLRGKAMECISLIGLAVGREKFFNDAKDVMDVLVTQQSTPMDADDPQVQYLQSAWGRIAKVLDDAFIPYLPVVMPSLLEVARKIPDQVLLDLDADESKFEATGYEFAIYGGRKIGVRTSVIEEKAHAIHLLGCYVDHLKEGFFDYLQETMDIVVPVLHYFFDEDTRVSAGAVIPDILPYYRKGLEQRNLPLDPLQRMFSFILAEYLKSLPLEFALDVVCSDLVSFQTFLDQSSGVYLSEEEMSALAKIVLTLLDRSNKRRAKRAELAKVHDVDEDEAELIEDEQSKEDQIISSLGEIVAAVVKRMRAAFMPFFAQLEPTFFAMLDPNQDVVARQTSICVYCDVIENVVEAHAEIAPKVAGHVLQYSADQDAQIRLAAVYALGPLGQVQSPHTIAMVPSIVQRLLEVVAAAGSGEDDERVVVENALSSMLKIAETYTDVAAQVIPLILQGLPLRADVIEARIVHDKVLNLIEQNNPHLFGEGNCNVPQIIDILSRILQHTGPDPLIYDSSRARVENILRVLQGEN